MEQILTLNEKDDEFVYFGSTGMSLWVFRKVWEQAGSPKELRLTDYLFKESSHRQDSRDHSYFGYGDGPT